MHKGPSVKVRLFVYPIIALAFVFLFYIVSLYALGYRLKLEDGSIVRRETGIIILASKPGNATVFLNGKKQRSLTPAIGFMNMTIKGVPVGEHGVRVEKEGFVTWEGRFKVEPSLVSWGNYIVLVPQKKKTTDFKFSGEIKNIHRSQDNKIITAITEDQETKTRFYYLVRTDSKEKERIFSEPILDGENVRGLDISPDLSRLIVEKKVGEKAEHMVLELRKNARVWPISGLFNIDIAKAVFSSSDHTKIYVKKGFDIHLLDYEQKNLSSVLASEVQDFYRNSDSIFLINKKGDNYSLLELTKSGKTKEVIKTVPPSATYKFEHIGKGKSFLLLADATKELIYYKKDNDNKLIAKVLAQNVDTYSVSPSKNRVLIKEAESLVVFDLHRNEFYDTYSGKSQSLGWFYDDGNIFYTNNNELYLVNFNGFYNQKIVTVSEDSTIISLSGTPMIYFLNDIKNKKSLSLFNFDF